MSASCLGLTSARALKLFVWTLWSVFDGFFCCSCSDVWWVLLLQLFRCLMGSSAAVVQMFDGFFCCSCSDVWWVLLQLFRCLMGSSAAVVQMFDGMHDVPLQDVSQTVSVGVSRVVCDSQSWTRREWSSEIQRHRPGYIQGFYMHIFLFLQLLPPK